MKVIILGGNTLGYGFVRSLGIMNIKSTVLYNSKSEIARLSKHVEESMKCPSFSDYEKLNMFLTNKKETWKASLLLPSNDPQIEFLAKYKENLSKYFIVPIPGDKTVRLFLDKKETYNIAEKAGVAYPFTIYPTSIPDVKTYYNRIDYPVMIKPRERHKFYKALA